MSARPRPATAVIGAGRLAGSLAPRLRDAGYPIVALASPGGRSARRLRRRLGVGSATADPRRAAQRAALVLLAVPDREIAQLAAELAGGAPSWAGRTVLHHAGALGADVLSPLSRSGAAVGVLHPLASLAAPAGSASMLAGCAARIEGDRRGSAMARRVASDLGLVPLALPPRSGTAGRELYHAAAALASNDLLALLDLAAELLMRAGLSRRAALEALLPLARGTLAQARSSGLGGSLTGPVVRGDSGTLSRHLRRLGRTSRRAAEVHRLLSLQLLETAGSRLTPRRRAELLRLLRTRR